MLHSRGLPEEAWENVLHDALHSTRSLLCTSTNTTPHERFFNFQRRSMLGKSLPNWLLIPGPVLLRNHVRNKSDPLCLEVELIESNTNFAQIRYKDGKESTVSTKDLAPFPSQDLLIQNSDSETPTEGFQSDNKETPISMTPDNSLINETTNDLSSDMPSSTSENNEQDASPPQDVSKSTTELRRSTRSRKPPVRYGYPVSN